MGKITVTPCDIEGLYVIEPTVFKDERGYFVETYNQNDMKEAGLDMVFVQDNQSMSTRGVLRGLHFQKQFPQGKLVRVVRGKVFDVAVDLRSDSKTYGKWFGVELSAENMKQFYIPEGFAHGFLVLSDEAEFCYKCTDFYHPNDEGGLAYNDPDIGVQWPIPEDMELILSEKEENYKAIGAAAGLAYNQIVGAESAVDINLAKQLNVVTTQLGVNAQKIVMNIGSAAAGYGYEYVVSTMDRIKGAALSQNDNMLQMPIITPVSAETWGVKEATASEADMPEWGSADERGIDMEVMTAAADLAAGSDAVILRHPEAVATISRMIKALA